MSLARPLLSTDPLSQGLGCAASPTEGTGEGKKTPLGGQTLACSCIAPSLLSQQSQEDPPCKRVYLSVSNSSPTGSPGEAPVTSFSFFCMPHGSIRLPKCWLINPSGFIITLMGPH